MEIHANTHAVKDAALLDTPVTSNSKIQPNDVSLLVMSREEIERHLEAWRKQEARLDIVV